MSKYYIWAEFPFEWHGVNDIAGAVARRICNGVNNGLTPDKVKVRVLPDWDAWLAALPNEPVDDFQERFTNWFLDYGANTDAGTYKLCLTLGDYDFATDVPRDIAEIAKDLVAGSSISDFDVMNLIMTAIDECLIETEGRDDGD
jgi:hypothetical protein